MDTDVEQGKHKSINKLVCEEKVSRSFFIYIVKIVHKLCITLRIVAYQYAPHPATSMTAYFIDTDLMVVQVDNFLYNLQTR
jgi:hypothetical protein